MDLMVGKSKGPEAHWYKFCADEVDAGEGHLRCPFLFRLGDPLKGAFRILA